MAVSLLLAFLVSEAGFLLHPERVEEHANKMLLKESSARVVPREINKIQYSKLQKDDWVDISRHQPLLLKSSGRAMASRFSYWAASNSSYWRVSMKPSHELDIDGPLLCLAAPIQGQAGARSLASES